MRIPGGQKFTNILDMTRYFWLRIQNVVNILDTFGYAPFIPEGVSNILGLKVFDIASEISGAYPNVSKIFRKLWIRSQK